MLAHTIQNSGWTGILAGGYDEDVQDWIDRVEAAGESISDATKGYVNTFVLSAKSNDYWDRFQRLNLFCGDSLSASLHPLVIDLGDATDQGYNWIESQYDESEGLTCNGPSGDDYNGSYLDTGINCTSFTANDTHQSVYQRLWPTETWGTYHRNSNGAYAAPNAYIFHAPYTNKNVYDDMYNTTTGRNNYLESGGGHYIGSRISSTDHKTYSDGVQKDSQTTSGGSLPNLNYFVFIYNNNGTPFYRYGGFCYAMYSVGYGLTSTQVSDFTTDLATFMESMGRDV